MTNDEIDAQITTIRNKAEAHARNLAAQHAGKIDPILFEAMLLNESRLSVLEGIVSTIGALESTYAGDYVVKSQLELRDYWETVLEGVQRLK